MKIFAERLISLRKEKNLSQHDIALLLNITQQGYSRYESNQSIPSQETLVKLADIFNVSTDYILGRTDDDSDFSARQWKEK